MPPGRMPQNVTPFNSRVNSHSYECHIRFSHAVSAATSAASATSPSGARTLRGLAYGADGHLAEASVLELPGDLRGEDTPIRGISRTLAVTTGASVTSPAATTRTAERAAHPPETAQEGSLSRTGPEYLAEPPPDETRSGRGAGVRQK